MLSHEQRKEFLKKEIEINKTYIEMMGVMKEVTQSFVGKVFNKRYTNALEEAINKRFAKGEKKEYLINANVTSSCFFIYVQCLDSYMTFKKENGSHVMPTFRNYYKSFGFPPMCLDFAANGKIRFAPAIIEEFEEHITNLLDIVEAQFDDLEMCDGIMEDFQKVQNTIEEFEKKYSYSLRDAFGVLYDYVDRSDIYFRF